MTQSMLLIAASILPALIPASLAFAGGERIGARRIQRVAARARYGVVSTAKPSAAQSLRRDRGGRYAGLDGLAQTLLPKGDVLRKRLAATGRPISPGGYVAASLGVALVAVLLAHVTLGLGIVLSILLAIGAGFGLPHFYVGFLISRRMNKFIKQFPDAIDLMVRGIKSGLPITETMASVGQEMDAPVGEAFRDITSDIRFGRPIDEALWEAVGRLPVAEFKFFVISLSIQRETGGNLGETLHNLGDLLRKRKQMKLKIKAMSSEAKASAMILGSLPFVTFGAIYVMSNEYVMMLFTDPRGNVLLGFGLTAIALCAAVMSKMIRFEI